MFPIIVNSSMNKQGGTNHQCERSCHQALPVLLYLRGDPGRTNKIFLSLTLLQFQTNERRGSYLPILDADIKNIEVSPGNLVKILSEGNKKKPSKSHCLSLLSTKMDFVWHSLTLCQISRIILAFRSHFYPKEKQLFQQAKRVISSTTSNISKEW